MATSAKPHDGAFAAPSVFLNDNKTYEQHEQGTFGLTKREFGAFLIMAGLMQSTSGTVTDAPNEEKDKVTGEDFLRVLGVAAVRAADSVIAALNTHEPYDFPNEKKTE